MTYFLEHIAQSLPKEFGNTLNRHCLVFPNRRAGLYFLKYLAAEIEKPVWAPAILTINELFRSHSTLQTAGNELLLFKLYEVYSKLKKSHESFDDFYYWGDILVNDFDDVDKYLVNASLLFHNVLDLKNINRQFESLTDDQIEIIRRFWTNYNYGHSTKEKSGFIDIWSVLYDLYTDFKNSLRASNLAYEGMLFRDIAESISDNKNEDGRWDMLHFIGFNALNECEKVLMDWFRRSGKARFYWDYDNSYINSERQNSAGFFLRKNLKMFGNDMPPGWNYNTMISPQKLILNRRVIETSSDVAQVKLVSQLLKDIPDINRTNSHHTAVVLADENLIMPVLTSLPEDMGDVNITMGYPLKQTLVYTFLKHLMELQRAATKTDGSVWFGFKDVICILKNSLLEGLMSESDNKLVKEILKTNFIRIPADRFEKSEQLSSIFRKPGTPAELSDYFKDILSGLVLNHVTDPDSRRDESAQINIRNEFIYRVVLSVNRLASIVNSYNVSFTTETYIKILDRMLRSLSVPFSGEPLSGIQVMGILETRALDFKNLIILSVNEGILPEVSSGSSFIPFSLREAFGLPSVNHQESIYAYHFFRLLQRAEYVTFIYNSNSEGLRSGEISRFLIQMKYDNLLNHDFMHLDFDIKTHITTGERIERKEEHSEQLVSYFLDRQSGRSLSPSAINTWLFCRMKFFYRYINRLMEPATMSTDIDPVMLGNILHEIMKNLYYDHTGSVLTVKKLDSLIRNHQFLEQTINKGISEKFNNGRNDPASGNELIVRDVLMTYLLRILETDKALAPVSIYGLEDSYGFVLSRFTEKPGSEISIGGKIDRIDNLNGVIRMVDYKTGTVSESVNSIDDLFVEDREKDSDGWLQTLLYCEAYRAKDPVCIIRPSVYKIKKLTGNLPSDKLKIKIARGKEIEIDNYETVREEFLSGLKSLVATIFSDTEPFIKTTNARGKCSYCPYKILCMR